MQLPDEKGIPAPFMRVPEYKGESLSVMSRITSKGAPAHLWHYTLKLTPLPNNLDTINQLTEQGYKPVEGQTDSERGHLIAYLVSQLHDVVGVQDGGNITIWAHSQSIDYVQRYPVLLCFTLKNEEHPDTEHIQMLQPLPLPRYGEYAVIGGKDAKLYNSRQLDESARQLKSQLANALRDLGGESEWSAHNQVHAFCANELQYLAIRADLHADLLSSRGKQLQEIKTNLEKLEKAHHEVVTLRQSWLRPDWLYQWKEISRMAQELAANYYDHHQSSIDRKKSPVPVPDLPDAFNAEGIARMLTSLPIEAYTVAMTAPASEWSKYPSDKENELILGYPYKKPSGLYHVLVKEDATGQDREKVLARMEKGIADMGDYDSDLFMMMVLQLMVGRRNENGNVVMSAHKALEYHGAMAKKNANDYDAERTGGPRWEVLERWSESYLRMKNKWMKLDEVDILDENSKPDRRGQLKRARISREAPLFMFGEVITHQPLPLDGEPGKTVIIAWEYREATWMLPFIKGRNAYTSGIMRDCFMFDPYHETWEKRLSKHFFFWLRRNAKYEKPYPPTVRELFDELHLDIDERHPQRTRDRFERAMNVLAGEEPRIIGKKKLEKPHLKWEYADAFELPRRNWLETWLAQKIKVTPPEINQNAHILDAYRERRELIQEQEAKNAAKKRRGRPPGSKNKNKKRGDANQK